MTENQQPTQLIKQIVLDDADKFDEEELIASPDLTCIHKINQKNDYTNEIDVNDEEFKNFKEDTYKDQIITDAVFDVYKTRTEKIDLDEHEDALDLALGYDLLELGLVGLVQFLAVLAQDGVGVAAETADGAVVADWILGLGVDVPVAASDVHRDLVVALEGGRIQDCDVLALAVLALADPVRADFLVVADETDDPLLAVAPVEPDVLACELAGAGV